MVLVLRLLYINTPTQKKSCKESLVGPIGPSSLKIIFAQLIKVIAVYVWLTIVHLWYLSLKKLLALRWKLSRSLVWLQVGPHELFKQFIGGRWSRSRNWSRNRSGNQSENQFGAWGRVTRRSGGDTTWMRTSNWARVPSKLIFHKIKRREVPTGGTTRARSFGSHLGRWLEWIGE